MLNRFSIEDISTTLVLGSCDARNLSRLIKRVYGGEVKNIWGIFYNPFSIYSELERLIDKSNKWEFGVYKFKKNGITIFCDPWRSWIRGESLEELRHKNKLFDRKALKTLLKLKNLVLVFGLAEVWFHKETNTIMNRVPIELPLNQINKEYGVRLAGLASLSRCLSKTMKICNEKLDINVTFTVSPVPLKYSSLNKDIVSASNKSKSNLVNACKSVVCTKVSYFPEYELLSHHSYFQEDGRHLTPEAIAYLLSLLIGKSVFEDLLGKKFYVPKVNKYGIIKGRLYLKSL